MLEVVIAAQLECLSQAVFAEARGEPFAGQVMVAGVIKNRVLDGRFESDFCSVIKEPWQFSFINEVSTGALELSIEQEKKAWKSAQEAAYAVFNSGNEALFGDILYYHADYVHPNWDYSQLSSGYQVGAHIFYKDK